ncbi:MAG TPA: hypothetical protein VJ110_02210 [Candidatus Nanoarchaeia archaeon]|nr:hypothetical protein [Candidatus Nanoarchaeia archaeon]
MKTKQREIAKKTWICNLIKGEFHKSEGWTPGYILHNEEKYTRVSIVASVVAKFLTEDGNYATITLDDGTETIRLKTFGPDVLKIRDIRVGGVVRCVGKVRMYNDEIYVAPEIVRALEDPNWLLVHRLQLGPPEDVSAASEMKPQVSEQAAVEALKEEVVSVQKKILDIIRSLDAGMGSDMSEVMEKSGLEEEEARNVLFSLLKSGEIYEPRKGKLKVLD